MKKTKNTASLFMTLLTAIVLLVGCKKNADEQGALDEQSIVMTSEADAEADILYNEVFDNVMGVDGEVGLGAGIGVFKTSSGEAEPLLLGRTDSSGQRCFTVTVTPQQSNSFPRTIVIDFGAGCLGRDGRLRKGKISTVYTGRMVMPGSKATTTFDNHFVDSIKVEGTHSVENVSTSNQRSFNLKVVNGKLSKPSGDYTLHNKNKTWLQTEGNGTPLFPVDDVFSITGNSSGTVKRGTATNTWTSDILQAVIRKFTCRWPVSGQVQTTRNSRTGLLDYGNGACDNKATLTINGVVHHITLR